MVCGAYVVDIKDGDTVGKLVGETPIDGASLGSVVMGKIVGVLEGSFDGSRLGPLVGKFVVGCPVGILLGLLLKPPYVQQS